jgi:two-component system alkaline phosphatase synthesis response regulator PhoP
VSTRGTILVVDDEFSILESLAEILSWEGYDVVTAGNGREGLACVANAAPQLILADYMMPVMNGIDMIHRLRSDPRSSKIPIVMMTAAPLKLGQGEEPWDALLRKPFELDALMELVHRFIPQAQPTS